MSNSLTSAAPNNQILYGVSRKPPTTALSRLSLDLLIRYIDNVLSAIINQGLGCKIIDSGTQLRDLVQPVTLDFSKLFDGISEGAKMFSDQKFLKSHLSTEALSMAVDVLKGLGNAHWVAVGLLAIANVLERFDNISANDRECIDLLKAMLKLGKYLKQIKDINADLHNEILELMSESVKLIVSGAILCCSFITSNKLSKFLLIKKIRDDLVYVRGKVDSMKTDLMLQMHVLTVATLTFHQRQYNVTGGNEENNSHRLIEQDPSEQSKNTESEIEESRETEIEGSGSDTIHSEQGLGGNEESNSHGLIEQDPSEQSKDTESEIEESRETAIEGSWSDTSHAWGQNKYNGVNEHQQLEIPLRSSRGLGKFLKKTIPTIFGLQKPSPGMRIKMLLKEIQLSPIEFKRDELKRVTQGFTRVAGRGGFGNVYCGTLSDGKRVAIKILRKESRQGENQWINELRTLTRLKHRNIAELVGYCCEDNLMLVYDYMPRNLSDVIFGEIEMIIDWPTKLRIILDMIRAIAYLHEGADVCIVHGDIKPSNILLDGDFNAKICDFGLARILKPDYTLYVNTELSTNDDLFLKDATESLSTSVAGTIGYIAPEYALHGHLSVKSDIYSFGVTLLNIVSGKRVTELTDELFLTEHAWRLHEEDRLHELIDSQLLSSDGLINSNSISRTILTALWCTHTERKRRPSASRVFIMLSSEVEIPIPTRSLVPYSLDMLSGESYRSGESFHTDMLSGESCEY